MATTKAPLFGLDASGTIAGALVFSKWKGRTYVRRHAIPANPKSGTQVGMRSVFRFLTQDWANLSTAIKDKWDARDSAENFTALNSMVRYNQRLARRNLGWWQDPSLTPGTAPDAPTVLTVTPQPKALKVTWTNATVNTPDYSTAIVLSTSSLSTYSISQVVRVIAYTDTEETITGLTTGTTYYVRCLHVNTAGELGALATEASDAPT